MDGSWAIISDLKDALAALPPIDAWDLALFAGTSLVGLGLQAGGRLRYAYHAWRLERRLRRDPYMLREEMNGFNLAIGEDRPEFEIGPALGHAVIGGLYVAVPIWLAGTLLEDWLYFAPFVLGLLAFPYFLWRRLNDPEPKPLFPDVEIPREAVIGFFGAVALVAAFIVFAGRIF